MPSHFFVFVLFRLQINLFETDWKNLDSSNFPFYSDLYQSRKLLISDYFHQYTYRNEEFFRFLILLGCVRQNVDVKNSFLKQIYFFIFKTAVIPTQLNEQKILQKKNLDLKKYENIKMARGTLKLHKYVHKSNYIQNYYYIYIYIYN